MVTFCQVLKNKTRAISLNFSKTTPSPTSIRLISNEELFYETVCLVLVIESNVFVFCCTEIFKAIRKIPRTFIKEKLKDKVQVCKVANYPSNCDLFLLTDDLEEATGYFKFYPLLFKIRLSIVLFKH